MAAQRLRLLPIERDRFGRIVGDLYAENADRVFINLALVERGDAVVYRRFCNDSRFDQAEREARGAKRGIWSRPGPQQRPWLFRRGKRVLGSTKP